MSNSRYLDKNEIVPMKLRAIIGRSKNRDLIDIAYLLKEMALEDMFNLYKEKYGAFNSNILKRELLIKSNAIKDNDWLLDVKMIRNDIEPKDIPDIIKQAIEEYNKKKGIGKSK